MRNFTNTYLHINGRKNYLLISLKILSIFFTITLVGFYLFMVIGHGGLPSYDTLTQSEQLMFIAVLGMLIGSIISMIFEFWGALTMFAFYALKTFVNGIDFNLFFDAFLYLSIFCFLIYYLKNK